jgi:hypothetical protein
MHTLPSSDAFIQVRCSRHQPVKCGFQGAWPRAWMNARQLWVSAAASAVVNRNPAFPLTGNFDGNGAAFSLFQARATLRRRLTVAGAAKTNAVIQAFNAFKLYEDQGHAPNQ